MSEPRKSPALRRARPFWPRTYADSCERARGARLVAVAAIAVLVLGACTKDEPTAPGPKFPTPSSPQADGSESRARFLAVGDAGTGDDFQAQLIEQMCELNASDPFTDIVQAGDNIYDHGEPEKIETHFIQPNSCLFDAGVKFHSVLGNHDIETDNGQAQLADPRFGMAARNFTFALGPVSFIVIETNTVPDEEALTWLDEQIATFKNSPWTAVLFHQPPYSPGTSHGSNLELRAVLAERFAKGGVDLVINGHEHLYARADVGRVTYVITGGAGRELYACSTPLENPYKVCASVHEFVEFDAGVDHLTLTAHAVDGSIIDSYEVPKNQ